MARNVTVELDTKVLDNLIKHLNGNVEEAVKKTAFAIEGEAKVQVQRMEAIDTGALLNSIATTMKGWSNAPQAMGEARRLRPEAEMTSLPVPSDSHTAHVGPTVEYGLEVHMGAHNMPGRPYLLQAVRNTESKFRDLLKKAVTP